jgi:hypothetical protein
MMAKPTKVVKKSVPFVTAYSFLLFSPMPFLISPLFTPTTIITKRAIMDDVPIHSLFDLQPCPITRSKIKNHTPYGWKIFTVPLAPVKSPQGFCPTSF